MCRKAEGLRWLLNHGYSQEHPLPNVGFGLWISVSREQADIGIQEPFCEPAASQTTGSFRNESFIACDSWQEARLQTEALTCFVVKTGRVVDSVIIVAVTC
jgi:hypothetical protein